MNSITQEQWEKLARLVHAGARIYVPEFDADGILLENFPYDALEDNAKHRARWPELLEDDDLWNPNYLRYQSIRARIFGHSVCDAKQMTFFIDGQWFTFDEVVAVK